MSIPVGKLSWILPYLGASAAFAQQYTITTVAGGAPPATPATAAAISIGQPRRVTVDSSGNVYFSSANSVFKLSGSGVLTLVAGNSRAGFSGDGGAAVTAQLNGPQGLAVDSTGNLYIADAGNNRVRLVDPTGIITTFAGSGGTSPGGPGTFNDGGPAANALLHLPQGVAVDKSGNVFIADTGDNRICKVTPDGTITSVAGDSLASFFGDGGNAASAELQHPSDVAVDSSGNLYIADTANAAIRKVTTDGLINSIAGNGTIGFSGDAGFAVKAGLIAPMSVAVDSSGNVFIVENGDSRIRQIDTKGNINTIAGTGTAGFGGDGSAALPAQFNSPSGIAVDSSGSLFIADSLNLRIRKIAGSNISTVAGNGLLSDSGDGGAATAAQLNSPLGVAVDSSGNLYVADTGNNVVRKIAPGGVITNFAGNGTAGFGGDGGAATSAQLNGPQGLAVDASGNLYIADAGNARIREVSGGTITTVAGSGTAGFSGDGGSATGAQLNFPSAVAVDAAGNLYIADFSNNRIRKVSGATITTIAGNGNAGFSGDGGQATSAQLNTPRGVAVDASNTIYIADTGNNLVRRVTAGGAIFTLAGNGAPGFSGDGGSATAAQVGNPAAVAVDAGANVYIADGSARVRKVFSTGTIVTIAGNGALGYSGDGGAATSASLSAPSAIALNAANVYLADTGNNAVRLLRFAGFGLTIGAVTNGATNLPGAISPGEIVVIYGSGLGPAQPAFFQSGANGLVSTTAGGTSVFFSGSPGPVLYASANQVAAIVPYAISGSSAQVIVQFQGQPSAPVAVAVAPATPALFTLDSSGKGQAAAINNRDGSVNGPSHPASAGDVVQLYATGTGQTNPPGTDGELTTVPFPLVALPVTVTIGGQSVTQSFAGNAPGIVAGVTQINVPIPNGLPAGPVPVVVKVGGVATQAGVTIVVSGH